MTITTACKWSGDYDNDNDSDADADADSAANRFEVNYNAWKEICHRKKILVFVIRQNKTKLCTTKRNKAKRNENETKKN